jgi:hypothetical protein
MLSKVRPVNCVSVSELVEVQADFKNKVLWILCCFWALVSSESWPVNLSRELRSHFGPVLAGVCSAIKT